jgi:tRNA A64-2'-O-ribosylphosphate transferase
MKFQISTNPLEAFPDALSKTVPIWVAVFNRALFPKDVSLHGLQAPQDILGSSEIAQIEKRLENFVMDLEVRNSVLMEH